MVAVLLGLVACTTTANDTRSATQGLPNILQQLSANPWTLDTAASSLGPGTVGHVSIVFADNFRLSGETACGHYRGTFSVDETAIRVRNVRYSIGSCPTSKSSAVHKYLAAITSVDHVAPSSRNHLVLTGSSGVRLTYDAPALHPG